MVTNIYLNIEIIGITIQNSFTLWINQNIIKKIV